MYDELNWQPSADIAVLKKRANMLAQIRRFFEQQGVWEVETPILSHFAGTDVNLEQWQTSNGLAMHTSPEFAMKRLLAAGSGDIYQICRVFRKDEQGQRHNPEFTMLEWYRVGMDEFELMQDVQKLIQTLTGQLEQALILTYREAFIQCDLPDPLTVSDSELHNIVDQKLDTDSASWLRDDCLDALMSLIVEPSLPSEGLCFIHQYPASQAALAEYIEVSGMKVARRFELYWQGMELANGYFELVDAEEQARRFSQDNCLRKAQGKAEASQDQRFLAALAAGMPVCAGVALGLDRLMMILLEKNHIQNVVAFPFERA